MSEFEEWLRRPVKWEQSEVSRVHAVASRLYREAWAEADGDLWAVVDIFQRLAGEAIERGEITGLPRGWLGGV